MVSGRTLTQGFGCAATTGTEAISILSWSTKGANFGFGAEESNRRISISHSYSGSKYFGNSVFSTESRWPPILRSRFAELCRTVAVVTPIQPPRQ